MQILQEQKSALPPTPVGRATVPSSEPALFFIFTLLRSFPSSNLGKIPRKLPLRQGSPERSRRAQGKSFLRPTQSPHLLNQPRRLTRSIFLHCREAGAWLTAYFSLCDLDAIYCNLVFSASKSRSGDRSHSVSAILLRERRLHRPSPHR